MTKSQFIPVCNTCGTPMHKAISQSAFDFWCPKCQLGQWDINNNGFERSVMGNLQERENDFWSNDRFDSRERF